MFVNGTNSVPKSVLHFVSELNDSEYLIETNTHCLLQYEVLRNWCHKFHNHNLALLCPNTCATYNFVLQRGYQWSYNQR